MSAQNNPLWDPAPHESRYWLLLEITEAVARSKDVVEAFKELAPTVLALTGGETLDISLHDSANNLMVTEYWKKNQDAGRFPPLPVEQSAAGWAWKHQSPIRIADIQHDGRYPEHLPALLALGVRSYTALPISTATDRFGALGLGKNAPELPAEEDVEFLSRIASLGALALAREKAIRAFQEQQSLVAISRELSSVLELDKLLPVVLASLRGITRYERAVLCIFNDDGKSMHRYGDDLEWEPHVNHGDAVPLGQTIVSQAIESRSITLLSAEHLRRVTDPLAKAMLANGVQSVCTVPLMADNQVWGALQLNSLEERAFSGPDLEYLEQVANQIAAALRNAHAYHEIAELKERLAQEKRYLENEIQSANPPGGIVGSSPALQRVLENARIVAATDSTVLLTGETGTGKERIARVIHGMSRCKERNFIKLNCAAIPSGLLESELFGHERGAFTGAVTQKLGRLELADQGTLLLDEIGEIPLELQPKLLRVLQDQEFERLGGNRTIRVKVRLIASTNRDLRRAMDERRFREDLFYRLHVFPLHLPALRERKEDIPDLIRHFVETCSVRLRKNVTVVPDEAMTAMMNWHWPGNIRELENFIERSVILSSGSRLTPPLAELRQDLLRPEPESAGTLRDQDRKHIAAVLRQTKGVLSGPSGAAARLGLKRTTLQYKMQRLGISRTDFLG